MVTEMSKRSAERRRPGRFVLVAGAWLGAWCWQDVTRALRVHGNDVYTVTLTGLGERVHLARPETDLETHIADVVNLLDDEDLADVTLVGHSYGGTLVTGVANRRPERLARLELPTGHWPMFSAPNDLAAVLHRLHLPVEALGHSVTAELNRDETPQQPARARRPPA